MRPSAGVDASVLVSASLFTESASGQILKLAAEVAASRQARTQPPRSGDPSLRRRKALLLNPAEIAKAGPY
jgi:hypothetical protein